MKEQPKQPLTSNSSTNPDTASVDQDQYVPGGAVQALGRLGASLASKPELLAPVLTEVKKENKDEKDNKHQPLLFDINNYSPSSFYQMPAAQKQTAPPIPVAELTDTEVNTTNPSSSSPTKK